MAVLAWVQGRGKRYELADGRNVFMTAGGTVNHGLIAGNLSEMLGARLDRTRSAVDSGLAPPGASRAPAENPTTTNEKVRVHPASPT